MGAISQISVDKFPKQGSFLNKKVNVCFQYDTNKTVPGIIVRDDMEEPGIMIIHLIDDRYVLATECQYQIINYD